MGIRPLEGSILGLIAVECALGFDSWAAIVRLKSYGKVSKEYPSHLKPEAIHLVQAGFCSSHLTLRVLYEDCG